MVKSIKKKWLAALRSGRYTQGVGLLFSKTKKTHCCLGVLRVCVTGRNQGHKGIFDTELLSSAFLKKVGLKDEQQGLLSQKNDGWSRVGPDRRIVKWSFKKIASHIERYY